MGLRTRILNALGFKKEEPQQPTPRRLRRSYAGAVINRLSSDWITGSTSADAEIKNSLGKLRDRSRQLVRDNPHAANAVRVIRLNVVGSGMKLQAQVMNARGTKRATSVNAMIERSWDHWCRVGNCELSGRHSFRDLEYLIAGAIPTSGEIFFRIHRKAVGKSKVKLSLEPIEGDQLDENYAGKVLSPDNEWRMGIEMTPEQRPVRYALYNRHPGDQWVTGNKTHAQTRHKLVPADDIIHLTGPLDRPLQSRGVPWFASVMSDLHQLSGYDEAATIRARSAASVMGFITSDAGEISEYDDVEGEQRITEFEPGKFHYLNSNEGITVPDLGSPDQQYDMFTRAKTRRFAAGMGISYQSCSKDFSETNYSSARLSLLEDRDHYKKMQQYMIEHFHLRVFREWLDLAVLGGELKLADYEVRPERYDSPMFMCRGYAWVDPLKEANAYALMEDRGYMTKAQICSQLGTDLEDNLQQISRERKMAEDLGVALHSEVEENIQEEEE